MQFPGIRDVSFFVGASISRKAFRSRLVSVPFVGSLFVVLAVLAGLAALAFVKYREMQTAMSQPPPPESPAAVAFATVESVDYQQTTTSIGTIVAPQSITVSNELPGTVTAIFLEQGKIVEKGDLLVQLDTSVEEAQLDSAKARLQIATSTWKRMKQAAESRAISELELDESESQLKQATAQVAELEAIISRKSFRAPFRGRLGLSDTHVGQYLPAGSTITTLQSIDDYLFVDFMIPQSIASDIDAHQPVQIPYQNYPLTARIVGMDAQADRLTRNVRFRARIEPVPEAMLPGDSAQVSVSYGEKERYPSMPSVALRYSPQGAFVYVVEKNEKGELRASARSVVPSATVSGRVAIEQGVELGEVIVSYGSFKLREGQLLTEASQELRSIEIESPTRPVSQPAASPVEKNLP